MKNTKKYFLILLILSGSISLFAQTDTSYTYSYQLEGEAWQNWDSINDVWMNQVYFQCLKANKLKMSCAHCSSIYIDAGFTIDGSGKLIDIKIFKEKICAEKASEKLKQCFFGYYKNLVFPKALHNRKIYVKLGTGLKC